MNKINYLKNIFVMGLFVINISIIHAVDSNEKSRDKNVVAWSNDVPLLTNEEIENYKKQIIAQNPQFEQHLKMISPKELNKQIAEGMIQQKLVNEYIKESPISKQKDYQEALRQAQEAALSMVNQNFFMNTIDDIPMPSDKDLRKLYEEQKNISPTILISQGGVETVAVEFDKEDKAKSFLKSIEKSSIDEQATKQKLILKNLNFIHESTMAIDKNLQKAVLEKKKFPETFIVKGMKDNFFVVTVKSKKDTEYESFDTVKDSLAQQIMQQKAMQVLNSKMSELKNKYKVTFNPDFFDGKEEPLYLDEEELENAIEAMDEEEFI